MINNKPLHRIYNQTLKELIQTPIFWVGLVIKIIFSFLFASTFLKDLFIPFVNYFSETGLNPYQHFYATGTLETFPYPALMLYILMIPVKFFSLFTYLPNSPHLEFFIYRIPILLADLTILFVLSSFLKNYKKKVIYFYWLSPVLIYINYVHGQLDVIPMALIFTSLYFLIKDKNPLAYILLGCSLATKTHVLLMIPFLLAYSLGQKKSFKDVSLYALLTAATFFIINIFFITNPDFLQMVFHNTQQDKVYTFFFNFSDKHRFYLIPSAYMLLLILGFSSIKRFNKNILIMFLGFTFGILTFFIPPSQGWYYWIIPVFVFFYIKSNTKNTYAFWILQVLYFLYFLMIQNSDFLGILSPNHFSQITLYGLLETAGPNAQRIQDIIFTLLQTSVLVNCFYVYKIGIQNFTNQKISSLPYFIGIGGDSGAGKTTLSDSIQKLFLKNKTTVIRGDDMHKWERGDENWKTFTHLDPKANELHNEHYLLNQLKSGQSIQRRHYDHSTGKFTSSHSIEPNNIMIFEGLHPFYIKKMRNLYDLKIYVAPNQQLHHYWKIVRDVRDRGHSKEKVIEQINNRAQDSDKYIKSQNKFSDIEICVFPEEEITNFDTANKNIKLNLALKFSNDIHIEPLLEMIKIHGQIDVKHEYDDNDSQSIVITEELDSEKIEMIAEEAIANLDEIGIQAPEWEHGYLGFVQLFISYFIAQQVSSNYEH